MYITHRANVRFESYRLSGSRKKRLIVPLFLLLVVFFKHRQTPRHIKQKALLYIGRALHVWFEIWLAKLSFTSSHKKLFGSYAPLAVSVENTL